MELIGGHFLDSTIAKIKAGCTFRGTGDNFDLRILKGHMRSDNDNEDLHLFATNFLENRINFTNLPNVTPRADITTVLRSKFTLNQAEWKAYISTTKILIARVLLQFFPKFSIFKQIVPSHIEHKYTDNLSKKSFIVSMPIMDANENKYGDCVKILRTYEDWIAELYSKAGLLQNLPNREHPPLPEEPASVGQTQSHTLFTEGDVMKEMKIPFSGDQLTRVRFAGAKDLLAGSHTPTDRFEHCSPFKPVMWHCKASLLQYSYHLLHQGDSVNQQGTLKCFREKFNRKNATPSKVLDSYDGSEELFLSMGKAYIVTAAIKFFGMTNLDDKPTIHCYPPNLAHKSTEEKHQYFDHVLTEFVDTYVLQKFVTNEDDYVQNYGLCTIFLTLLLMQLKDTAKEGDGDRNLINQKLLLVVFKSLGAYSKYAIEMFLSIAQMECLLTPRLSEEFKWGFLATGKVGKEIM